MDIDSEKIPNNHVICFAGAPNSIVNRHYFRASRRPLMLAQKQSPLSPTYEKPEGPISNLEQENQCNHEDLEGIKKLINLLHQ